MSVMKKKMFLCGDYVNCYKCDQCGEKEVCSFQHWAERNFTLCSKCLEAAYRDLFQLNRVSSDYVSKKSIPKGIKQSIFARDSNKCRYCGSGEKLEADHVMPESRGGETSIENLVTACRFCNSKKGARTPEEAGMKLLAIKE